MSGACLLECNTVHPSISLEDPTLQVDVYAILSGHAESKIWADSRRKRLLHSADMQLFSKKSLILRETLEMRTRRTLTIPFHIMFPRTTQPDLRSLLWQDGARDVYEGNPEYPLPPSTFARSSHAAFPFLAVVEYFVGTRVSVRRSDGTMKHFDYAGPNKVYYEERHPEAVRIAKDFCVHTSRMCVGDDGLRRRLSQVRGIRAKARSIVSPAPHDERSIEIACHIPRQFQIGDPFTCVLSLSDLSDQHQVQGGCPGIYLTSAKLDLYDIMHVRTERLAGDMLESRQETGLLDMDFIIDPYEPFHAAARNTKTISTGRLMEIPISFATYNIARSFYAVVNIRIELHTCSRSLEFVQSVKICSGTVAQDAAESSQIILNSHSGLHSNMNDDVARNGRAASDEALPSYE